VEELPRALRSDVALLAYFEELWPGQVSKHPNLVLIFSRFLS